MPTKICTKCGEDKELGEYYAQKRGKHGRTSRCKHCHAKYNASNKEKIAERNAKWRESNKEKIAEQSAKYREANKDKAAKYYIENRDRILNQKKFYHKKNAGKRREYNKRYHTENAMRIREQSKAWRIANADRCKDVSKSYYEQNRYHICRVKREQRKADPEKEAVIRKRCREKNAEKIREQAKARYHRARECPAFVATCRIRTGIRDSLRGRVSGAFRHLPYTPQQLYDHLLTTLPEGYTEADICDGSKLHIDHIRPVSSFNLTGEIDDEFHKCWALSNLQLLPAKENLRKGASIDHLNTYQMELQL